MNNADDGMWVDITDIKIILRATQSITQQEWDNSPNSSLHITYDCCYYSPELFIYLIGLHIDLFGLIEAGLAIDKSKLTTP